MNEHDETLRKTLEEVGRLRSQREESLREVAATEFSGHMRSAERIYWVYGLICVALGVGAINFFVRSFDVKTLIGCAVVLLVIYETTVLMKLWFATARMKLDVMKDVKMLRLEVAQLTSQLASAAGSEPRSEPSVKYEPMRGVRPWERTCWLAACAVVAMGVSTWTSQAWFGGRDRATEAVVTLAADGSAEKRYETVQRYSGYFAPSGFSLYTPKDWSVQLLDPEGQQMPIDVVATDTHHRHDVTFTDAVVAGGQMRYTQLFEIPNAATLKDGVWTYSEGIRHAGSNKEYRITILLPPGAKLLSADPETTAEPDEDGRLRVHYEGTAEDDKQYTFTVRYELPETSPPEQ